MFHCVCVTMLCYKNYVSEKSDITDNPLKGHPIDPPQKTLHVCNIISVFTQSLLKMLQFSGIV